MEFRILGPLEVQNAGGPLDIGPLKQRSLLALLLVNANRVVSTDRILGELWGDEAAGKENALWVYVSRLRSTLEPGREERGQSSLLLTRDHGYMLNVDPDSIDAHRFEVAVGEGRSLLANAPEAASEVLTEALALWRGFALEDFLYQEFAGSETSRLEELRLNAVECRVEADLRRGLSGELVSELEALVREQPLRERPVSQLMLALYRGGRQADALRAFARFRRRIGEELGIEPSPELRRLEEQIVLHDPRLQRDALAGADGSARTNPIANPFKGLHAFREDDADDFFGRDRLVADVVGRLHHGARLIALVGPSGSGKSSVVRAGLIPALRRGCIVGSDRWLIASMVPGSRPFVELEAALLRATIDAPESLSAQLEQDDAGLLRAALRLLPDDRARLVLVIDQFEELFTLPDDILERERFLDSVVTAIDDPHGRVVVVLTMRADAYHHPLAHSDFGSRLGQGVVNIVPLTSDELEAAALEPAARCGVSLESALVAELLSDVIGEPGALPIFQYTLTDLFDRRSGDTLTVEAYRSMGGAQGALSRRADDLYLQLTEDEQDASKQLFLRLVTILDDERWSRRRVHATEILSLGLDAVAMEAVIDRFGRSRFLAFDQDPVTGAPTVEVAHEALLWEWERLREWIEESRQDVRRHAALMAAVEDWHQSGRDADYLFAGTRLTEHERWRGESSMKLTTGEQLFLDAALDRRRAEETSESRRLERESKLRRRSRRRLWALVAAIATFAVFVAGLVITTHQSESATVALVFRGRGTQSLEDLKASGLDEAQRDLRFDAEEVTPPFGDITGEFRQLARSETDLIIVADNSDAPAAMVVADDAPETTWAYLDHSVPGSASILFAEHEGAYLVGAAAALTSKTGTIGFIGGFQIEAVERFRAGYEAGARAVNPEIEVLATYLSLGLDGFDRDDLGRAAAARMYEHDVDVVFHAAGAAGFGVFEAARAHTAIHGTHVWAIGADADQYFDVEPRLRSYVLTSMIKRYDIAVRTIIEDFVNGDLEPTTRVLSLADGGVDFSTTGGFLERSVVDATNRFKQDIIAGRRAVPSAPVGSLDPPAEVDGFTSATLTFDGATCRYDGPMTFASGDIVRFDFVNTTSDDAFAAMADPFGTVALAFPARASGMNTGYAAIDAGTHYQVSCSAGLGADAVRGPTLSVVDR